jgi:hemerythrin superfamily protein
MALLEALKKDHNEVKKLLDKILDEDDGGKRKTLFDQMAAALTAHSYAEDKVLYSALKQKGEEEKELALEGEEEHALVEQLLTGLKRGGRVESHSWQARCKVLKDLVEHHVEEEESEFFKAARKDFDKSELDKMGKQFQELKQKELA